MEIPSTAATCAGCDKEMNLLNPRLTMQLKAERDVLVSEDVPSKDGIEVPEPNVYLGNKSGRGVIRFFHDFDCLGKWVRERKGLKPKLEYHFEEGDPYVPDDNRSPEELLEAGEISKAVYNTVDRKPAEGGEQ